MFTNRRKHKRTTVEEFCTLSTIKGSGRFLCKVTNISESGVGIEIDNDINEFPGINSEVVIYLESEEFGCAAKKAVVVWLLEKSSHKPGAAAGLEFI